MQSYLDIQEAFTKRAESCVLTGFVHGDSTPTVGWGHTGPEVRVGMAITPDQAETYFQIDQAVADQRKLKAPRASPAALAKRLSEHEKAADPRLRVQYRGRPGAVQPGPGPSGRS